jgi:hypothetical protein
MHRWPIITASAAVAAGALLFAATPASAATAGVPVSGTAGDAITIRPIYTGDVQGITYFTVPSGFRIDRIVSTVAGDQTAACGSFNATRTAIACGGTASHQNATSYLYAVATITDKARFGAQTANVRVQRASNDTGRVGADVDVTVTVRPSQVKLTGTAYAADGTATVSGTGVPGNTVRFVDASGSDITTGPIDADGHFSIDLPVGTAGLVVVLQGDGRGNESSGVGITVTPPLATPVAQPAMAGGAAVLAAGLAALVLRRRTARR